MTTADMPTESRRRLTRSRDGRVLAGVCQGAARYFDIDPVIFRVILAALTVFGGAGVVIYVLGWVLIPEETSEETRLERWLSRGRMDLRQAVLLALIASGVVIFLVNADVFGSRFGAAAVFVVAALLLTEVVGRRTGHGLLQPRRDPAPTYYGPQPAPSSSPTMPLPIAEPLAPRIRERAWLGWLTFGALMLVAGVLWLVSSSGVAHPQPADALAVCVAIAGLGLVVGAFVVRARAMIPIGLLLVLALALASALPRNLTWTAGTRSWAPVGAAVAPSYVLGAGKADLDLTGIDPATSPSVEVRIGAGRLMVWVPRGMGVDLDAKVGAGRLYVFGHEQDGTNVKSAIVRAAEPHSGTIHLTLQGGFGDLEVRNEAA